MDRREFLTDAGITAAFLLLWQSGCAQFGEEPIVRVGPVCRPVVSEVDRTMLALAETIVPGYATDPSGAPGSADTCALDLLYDTRYPAKQFLPLIASVVDAKSKKLYSMPFADLAPERRFEITVLVVKDLPPITWFYKFLRSAFYTDSNTMLGLDYMGYRMPPEGRGWRDDPEFSLRKPVGKEMTETGYLP
jgi:hypothetical protein